MEELYDWSNESFYFNTSYFNDSYLALWGNQSVPFFELFDYDYFDIGMRAKRILSEPDKVIAMVIGGLALLANTLLLVGLGLVRPRGKTSHHCLITSLCFGNILFCISVVLYIINKVVNPSYFPGHGPGHLRLRARCTFIVVKALNTTALNITLLNLTGMALDHWVCVKKPLLHPVWLSRRRAQCMVAIFWMISIICGFSDFFSILVDLNKYNYYRDKLNFCEFIWISPYQDEYSLFVIVVICLFAMIYLYVSIYRALKQDRRDGLPLEELGRMKRALLTTLLILACFMLCWLPMFVLELALLIQVEVNPMAIEKLFFFLLKADQHLYNLLLLNSLVDPVILILRVADVRFGCMRMFCSSCPHIYNKLRFKLADSDQVFGNGYRPDLLGSRASVTSVTAVEIERSTSRVSLRKTAILPNGNTYVIEEPDIEIDMPTDVGGETNF